SIILPSTPATTYSFSYSDNADQGFGELDYMKTPTGAEYRYRYRLEGTTLPTTVDIAQFNNVTTKKITHDGLADDFVWTYTFTNTASTITDTKTGAASTHFFFDRQTPYLDWNSGLVYRIEQSLGVVRKRIWNQNAVFGLTSTDANNAYIQHETV